MTKQNNSRNNSRFSMPLTASLAEREGARAGLAAAKAEALFPSKAASKAEKEAAELAAFERELEALAKAAMEAELVAQKAAKAARALANAQAGADRARARAEAEKAARTPKVRTATPAEARRAGFTPRLEAEPEASFASMMQGETTVRFRNRTFTIKPLRGTRGARAPGQLEARMMRPGIDAVVVWTGFGSDAPKVAWKGAASFEDAFQPSGRPLRGPAWADPDRTVVYSETWDDEFGEFSVFRFADTPGEPSGLRDRRLWQALKDTPQVEQAELE